MQATYGLNSTSLEARFRQCNAQRCEGIPNRISREHRDLYMSVDFKLYIKELYSHDYQAWSTLIVKMMTPQSSGRGELGRP